MSKPSAIKKYGENAILIVWKNTISQSLTRIICQLDDRIHQANLEGMIESVPSYNSLTLFFKSGYRLPILSIQDIIEEGLYLKSEPEEKGKLWEIPVCYHETYALDKVHLEEKLQMDFSRIVELHCQREYYVHFCGFLPGFFYLGSLDERLHSPRKSRPRIDVPKGSVAIAEFQTAVYPQDSPGGWHIIGRTKFDAFDPKGDPPSKVQIGDMIRFNAISIEQFKRPKEQL